MKAREIVKEKSYFIGDRPFVSSGNKNHSKRVHDFIGPVYKHMACPYEKEKKK